jgi:hypothetical protein
MRFIRCLVPGCSEPEDNHTERALGRERGAIVEGRGKPQQGKSKKYIPSWQGGWKRRQKKKCKRQRRKTVRRCMDREQRRSDPRDHPQAHVD